MGMDQCMASGWHCWRDDSPRNTRPLFFLLNAFTQLRVHTVIKQTKTTKTIILTFCDEPWNICGEQKWNSRLEVMLLNICHGMSGEPNSKEDNVTAFLAGCSQKACRNMLFNKTTNTAKYKNCLCFRTGVDRRWWIQITPRILVYVCILLSSVQGQHSQPWWNLGASGHFCTSHWR